MPDQVIIEVRATVVRARGGAGRALVRSPGDRPRSRCVPRLLPEGLRLERAPYSSAAATSPSGSVTITIVRGPRSRRTRNSWSARSESPRRLDASRPRPPRPERSWTSNNSARRRGGAVSRAAGRRRPELAAERARPPDVRDLEAFGNTRVHRLEEIARLLVSALHVQEPREPAGDGELPPFSSLRSSDVKALPEASLGGDARIGAGNLKG